MHTMKEMCEFIAQSNILIKRDGTHPTPVEIWTYSSTGELWMIWEWYKEAEALQEEQDLYVSWLGFPILGNEFPAPRDWPDWPKDPQ